MTLDADHRMYDYKLRHAVHLDRRNITQVHADDFEVSDRIFDALSMLNEGRYFFIENLDKHRTLWSQGAMRDLGLPSEHIDNCHDYWKTRVHPDDLEAYSDDIDQIYNGSKHRHVLQYRVRNAAGDYVLCRARGFRIDGDEGVSSLYVGELVNHSLAETVDAATGLGTQRMLLNAIDACRRDCCETGLIAVRVRGTTKLNELYGAEAVDNMLAEYAGRMLSITRGRSRVYRSRSVQFVVLSNDLDHKAFEELVRHLKEAVFAPVRIAGDTITPVCLVVPAFYERLTNQATAVLGELDRRLRTAGGLVPNDSLPIPEIERKSAIAERIDMLTGLCRPSEFMRRANAFLQTRRDGAWCIATVDMGHMRLFNEWHGQAEGDRVLADVGTVLKDIENADMGVAGYWGQDDFCILIPFERDTVHRIYSRIRETVAKHDDGVGFWPSMGVCPIDSNEEITIDAQAKAMFTNRRAKNDFKERIAIFRPEEYEREISFHRTLTEFQYALSNGRITYYLQPQVDMETGEIIGAEALTRWIDKDGSLISPVTFIPALEESGFVVTLDKYVWQGVASWLRGRIDRGLRVVPISLNVSRVDILACDVAEHMGALADQYNLPPELMRIEITETAYTGESEAVDKLTADLHNRGFSTTWTILAPASPRSRCSRTSTSTSSSSTARLCPSTAIKAAACKSFHQCSRWRSRSICPLWSKASRQLSRQTCYAKWAPATLRAFSTTAPCRQRILRHCSMVATATSTLARKTLAPRGTFVPMSQPTPQKRHRRRGVLSPLANLYPQSKPNWGYDTNHCCAQGGYPS